MEAVCICAGMTGLDRADASQLTTIVEVAVHGVHAGEIADTNVDSFTDSLQIRMLVYFLHRLSVYVLYLDCCS